MCGTNKARPEAYNRPIAAARRIFTASDAERVEPWIMPAIGLHDDFLGGEPEQLGTTRFGGRPDLPSADHWPTGPDGPLMFLGQISLLQIAAYDVDAILPKNGILSFFLTMTDFGWGHSKRDRDKFAVLYHPGEIQLHRQDFPPGILGRGSAERVRGMSPYLRWEVPTADPLAQETLGFGDCPHYDAEPSRSGFTDQYWRLEDDFSKPHIPVGTHKLLGWANGIFQQGEDCRLMCELARTGFPDRGSSAYRVALHNRSHWRCLLEISDDGDMYGGAWGDGGNIAFMIRDQDLIACNFDQCWCVLSTT